MTAEEMFKKLGLKKSKRKEETVYCGFTPIYKSEEPRKGVYYEGKDKDWICFSKSKQMFIHVVFINDFNLFLKAIKKQIEELGWDK